MQTLLKGLNKVSLKSYFLRRVARLEPPYIIVMFLPLIGSVFVSKNLSITEGFQSFSASTLTYTLIYMEPLSSILVPLVSEIEIQFYILAHYYLYFSLYKNNITRRVLLIFTTIFFSILSFVVTPPFLSILDYLQYFLVGFLLVDYYLVEGVTNKTSILRNSFTIIALLLILL